ncbi:hypothetical protein, partial [Kibdelosporangium philippinense]|uniref:hypothetical protein n=1 Tax=Kibdelosporangium philippinense TaxID=211113 RepID=UPI0035EEC7B1
LDTWTHQFVLTWTHHRIRRQYGSTDTSGQPTSPKRQAERAGIGFTALSNGFAATDDPVVLQAICDRLGPGVINVFLQRWFARLPLPFTNTDRDAGADWSSGL